MNATLLTGLIALASTCMLFSGSVVLFFRRKTVCSLLQVLGAGCLVVVVLTHVCEALDLIPWMHWGLGHSVGHYLDLVSAILGLTLFPVVFATHSNPKHRRAELGCEEPTARPWVVRAEGLTPKGQHLVS